MGAIENARWSDIEKQAKVGIGRHKTFEALSRMLNHATIHYGIPADYEKLLTLFHDSHNRVRYYEKDYRDAPQFDRRLVRTWLVTNHINVDAFAMFYRPIQRKHGALAKVVDWVVREMVRQNVRELTTGQAVDAVRTNSPTRSQWDYHSIRLSLVNHSLIDNSRRGIMAIRVCSPPPPPPLQLVDSRARARDLREEIEGMMDVASRMDGVVEILDDEDLNLLQRDVALRKLYTK